MYTIITLILLLVIAGIFFTQARRTAHEERAAVASRVQAVNAFIDNLESDTQRAAYIAGFRSFIAMEQHITSTGQPLSDPAAAFREIFLNGTLANSSFVIMQDSTFTDYLSRVQVTAAQQGIEFNATVSNVSLWQVDPWNVLVNYTLTADVTDQRGTAQWNITRTFTGRIPIIDLRDPLFTANTYGRVQRVIRPSNITVLVNDVGDANDTTGLMLHFNSSSYLAGGRGPSMLMRFAGNASDSEFGIESLVDTDEFTAQNLPVNSSASVVDYLYFRGVEADVCAVQNLPSKLKFDNERLDLYQIQGKLTYVVCP
jgi:hypothetical protein